MRISIVAFGAIGFVMGAAVAETAPPVTTTIDALVAQALAENPEARFYEAEIQAAKGEKRAAGLVVATIYHLNSTDAAQSLFAAKVKPQLAKDGVPVLAWFVTEKAANNYPRLPVREGERVLVWFTRFGSDADRSAHANRIARAEDALKPLLTRPPEILRLEPTDRSELR